MSECGVCFDPYTTSGDKVPQSLPCRHGCCLKCIKKLADDRRQTEGGPLCPDCRTPFDIKNDVLPNYQMIHMMSEYQNPEAAVAVIRCVSCSETNFRNKRICLDCTQLRHEDLYRTENVDEWKKNLICADCSLGAHKGHRIADYDSYVNYEKANRCRAMAESSLRGCLDEFSRNCQRGIEDVNSRLENMFREINHTHSAEGIARFSVQTKTTIDGLKERIEERAYSNAQFLGDIEETLRSLKYSEVNLESIQRTPDTQRPTIIRYSSEQLHQLSRVAPPPDFVEQMKPNLDCSHTEVSGTDNVLLINRSLLSSSEFRITCDGGSGHYRITPDQGVVHHHDVRILFNRLHALPYPMHATVTYFSPMDKSKMEKTLTILLS